MSLVEEVQVEVGSLAFGNLHLVSGNPLATAAVEITPPHPEEGRGPREEEEINERERKEGRG